MGRRLACLLLAGGTMCAVTPASTATAAVTCRSGFAVHESPGIRFFIAYAKKSDTEAGLYACTPRVRRPKLIYRNSPATTPSIGIERRFGNRIATDIEEYADGGNGVWAGWFDVRTGQYEEVTVRNPKKPADPESDNESWTQRTAALAVGPSGSLAWAMDTEGRGHELFVSTYAGGKLQRPRSVATLAEGELDPGTLRLTRTEVTWRTRGALLTLQVAPSAAPQPARQLRPVRGLACDAPSGIHVDDRMRFFTRRDGLFGCVEDRARAKPVRIARRGDRISLITLDKPYEGFLLRTTRGQTTANVFDTRTDRLRAAVLPAGAYGGRPEVLALAVRPDGGLVFVQDDDGPGETRSVILLAARGTGFAPPVTLATLRPDDIEPRSLRATKTTVTWRAVGQARSTPAN